MQNKSHSGRFRYIHSYSDISKHNQAYSGIFRNYSGIFWTLCNPGIFYIQNTDIFKTRGILRTLIYPKTWHIQNHIHTQNTGLFLFRTLGYSEPEAYSEPCQTSRMGCFGKQRTAINYFSKLNLILQYQPFMQFWIQRSLFNVKAYKAGVKEREAVNFDKYIFKVLQWYYLFFWLSKFSNLSATS